MDKELFRRAAMIRHLEERLLGLFSEETPSGTAPKCMGRQQVFAVGIDAEESDNLPWGERSWMDPFFAENFTPAEHAHCLVQPEPRLSFCELWSAKEAVFKCGPEFASLSAKAIEMVHDANGRLRVRINSPSGERLAGDCAVSVSHIGKLCVAICVKTGSSGQTTPAKCEPTVSRHRRHLDKPHAE